MSGFEARVGVTVGTIHGASEPGESVAACCAGLPVDRRQSRFASWPTTGHPGSASTAHSGRTYTQRATVLARGHGATDGCRVLFGVTALQWIAQDSRKYCPRVSSTCRTLADAHIVRGAGSHGDLADSLASPCLSLDSYRELALNLDFADFKSVTGWSRSHEDHAGHTPIHGASRCSVGAVPAGLAEIKQDVNLQA